MKKFKSTLNPICKKLKIERPRLKDWLNRNLITTKNQCQGQGIKQEFLIEDICAIEMFRRLIYIGFKRELASTIVNDISFEPEEEDSYTAFEHNGIIIAINAKQLRIDIEDMFITKQNLP